MGTEEWLTPRFVGSIFYVLTWLLIPHVLFHKKNPVSALAWIWAILLFPVVGAVFYLGFGTNRMSRKVIRRKVAAAAHLASERSGTKAPAVSAGHGENLSAEVRMRFRMLEGLTDRQTSFGNSADLLVNAGPFYDRLLADIEAAKHHLHIEFYIWQDDASGRRFLDALIAAAKRGVQVRLLVDEIGSIHLKTEFFRPLVEAGGKFSWFLSLHFVRTRFFLNLRNHRKLAIIDGRVAYLGGINIGDEYLGKTRRFGYWRDSQLRMCGPCVAQFQEVFGDDWFFATDEKLLDSGYFPEVQGEGSMAVQVIEDGPDSELTTLHMTCLDLIAQGRGRIWLETPYFIPYLDLIMQLQMAALKGLDVRLILSHRLDLEYLRYISRSYYEDLLRAGVKIYEYRKGILHSKMMMIDGVWSFLGSANLDIRSFRLNFELNVAVYDAGLAQRIEAVMLEDLAECRQVHLETFKRRPWPDRAAESVLRLLAPAV